MRKLLFLFVLVLWFSINTFGQVKTDYSGMWTFDKVISLPDEQLRTATFKMHVTQTPIEIKIERTAEAAINYPIGKEATIEIEGTGGKIPVKVKAELTNKGRLNLNSQQTVKSNIGEVSIKFKEIFELSPDGNTLKVSRELQPSKGFPITEMFIAKKQSEENVVSKKEGAVHEARDLKMQFSEGVLNGKAKHLEIPSYPNAASARRVTGPVPVRVIFDEEGKVIFAQAIFGHPLLKNEAIEAAMKSTFEPVELNGKIIKVSGIILYNFRP